MIVSMSTLRAVFGALCLALVFPTVACKKRPRVARVSSSRKGLEGRAERFVLALSRGAFRAARAGFDDKMLAAMPEAGLADAWRSLNDRVGPFRSVAEVRADAPRDGFQPIIVTTKHTKLAIDVRVVFDAHEKIAGLWFQPARNEWRAPSYVRPATFTESEVTVRELPGTLTLPKGRGPFRAVVLVHGSGPNDRDETVGANKPFRDLAQGLASRGIASLRYDKRTKHAPASLQGAFDQDDEVTFDARAAVALLAQRSEIDPGHIVIVGHSQGASMAPRIARSEPRVAAIALLAGDTRSYEKLVLDQWRYLQSLEGVDPGAAATKLEEIRLQFRAVRAQGDDAELLEVAGARAPRRYFRDLLTHRADEIARELSIPMFIAQGARDYQVTLEDLAGFRKALDGRANVTLRVYPTLNHLFVAGDGPPGPHEYSWPGHVDLAVIEDLSRFIRGLP